MECIFGISGKDFVVLGCDTTFPRSIMVMKHDMEKLYQLGSSTFMAAVGQQDGDVDQMCEFIAKNIKLYEMRNGYEMTPWEMANFARNQVAQNLRKQLYFVNYLIAGVDQHTGKGELYFMDYLGTLKKVPYASHGYAGFLSVSALDREIKPDVSLEEAKRLINECINEAIRRRFIINLSNFDLYVIKKDGLTKEVVQTVRPEGP